MLAFSNDYYGFIFRVTQSVELFCTYVSVTYKRKLNDDGINVVQGDSGHFPDAP